METSNKNSQYPPQKNREAGGIFTSPSNMVVIYTVFSILLKMQNVLGLEAMLEYISKYLINVERHHPAMKTAVIQALSIMSVEKIYKEAVSCEST